MQRGLDNQRFAGLGHCRITVTMRILAGIAWVVVSLLLWAIPCYLLYFGIEFLDRQGVRISPEVNFYLRLVPASGVVTILPLTAVLAMRGKLPWTGPRNSDGEGSVSEMEPSHGVNRRCS